MVCAPTYCTGLAVSDLLRAHRVRSAGRSATNSFGNIDRTHSLSTRRKMTARYDLVIAGGGVRLVQRPHGRPRRRALG